MLGQSLPRSRTSVLSRIQSLGANVRCCGRESGSDWDERALHGDERTPSVTNAGTPCAEWRDACITSGSSSSTREAANCVAGASRLRLRPQPSALLEHLVKHAGEVVTREDLRDILWPNGTFVCFDHGLNSCIKQLRAALGDQRSRTPIPRNTAAPRLPFHRCDQSGAGAGRRERSRPLLQPSHRRRQLPCDHHADDLELHSSQLDDGLHGSHA